MKYQGYEAVVSFDEENNIFHGKVINTRDVITFQGSSTDELRKAFNEEPSLLLLLSAVLSYQTSELNMSL